MGDILCTIKRDLLLAMRRRADVLTVFFFFLVAASLFPLGVGPETALLRAMGAGVIWVSALLAALLSLNRLFAGPGRREPKRSELDAPCQADLSRLRGSGGAGPTMMHGWILR